MLFSWFKRKSVEAISGISSFSHDSNHYLQQVCETENLEAARAWLLTQCSESDHSDAWDYIKHWEAHKDRLQQQLQSGTYAFQSVHEVEITDEQGHTSRREVRCAQDRLVIRALAQVLKPLLGEALSNDCVHLAGNGGAKAAVAQTQDYINQHPDHYVIKSDVKSYYASIDHTVLNEQFQQLLPNEPLLHALVWNFMRRTVEFGGNYRDVDMGLPLGASLSPLLGALYLSPLDELAKNTPDTFYRRYMDDWVWVLPKKRGLRKALKQQYGVLQTLRVAMHPDKTYIGKANKGFDFLGFHLSPTGVTVSDTALSRHEQKLARLYEQGASSKRIRVYRKRWLVWAGLAGSVALAIPASANVGEPWGRDADEIKCGSYNESHRNGMTITATQRLDGFNGFQNWSYRRSGESGYKSSFLCIAEGGGACDGSTAVETNASTYRTIRYGTTVSDLGTGPTLSPTQTTTYEPTTEGAHTVYVFAGSSPAGSCRYV